MVLEHAKDLDAPVDPMYLCTDEGPEMAMEPVQPLPKISEPPWWHLVLGVVFLPVLLPVVIWGAWDVLYDFKWVDTPPPFHGRLGSRGR